MEGSFPVEGFLGVEGLAVKGSKVDGGHSTFKPTAFDSEGRKHTSSLEGKVKGSFPFFVEVLQDHPLSASKDMKISGKEKKDTPFGNKDKGIGAFPFLGLIELSLPSRSKGSESQEMESPFLEIQPLTTINDIHPFVVKEGAKPHKDEALVVGKAISLIEEMDKGIEGEVFKGVEALKGVEEDLLEGIKAVEDRYKGEVPVHEKREKSDGIMGMRFLHTLQSQPKEGLKVEHVEGMKGQHILEQVAERMTVHIREGTSRAMIRLEPPDLGHIKLDIIVKDNVVKTHISAEHQAVKGVIEGNLNLLKNSLMQHGLTLEEVTISLFTDGREGWKDDFPFQEDRKGDVGGYYVETALPLMEVAGSKEGCGRVDLYV